MIGAWISTLTAAATTAASNVATSAGLLSLDRVTKGLLTTLLGLLGVFLVLLLFFVAIKIMQNIGAGKKSEAKE